MERRELLKTVGGIGAATATGGVGLLASSGGALAASGSLDISNTTISNDDGDVTRVRVALEHTVDWDGFDISVDAVAYQDFIQAVDSNGNVVTGHKLYDNTNSPPLLENWSGDGNNNGWGGAGEYTSGSGTQGSVNADIDWIVLSDDPAGDTSTETPGLTDDFNADNNSDGSNKTVRLRYVKRVVFFTTTDTGGASTQAADGQTTVYEMGNDDGTIAQVENTERFNVEVSNEEASASGGGSGTSSAE